jgi:hypothetical protein
MYLMVSQVFDVWIPSKELKKRGLYFRAQGYHVKLDYIQGIFVEEF